MNKGMVEKHMVSISNLVKKYPSGQEALKGVNLEVNANEILALIGPSGAGKSTLIRCVNRLVEPTSGKIIINGIDVCTLGYKALRMQRRKIGMIFQEYALVDRLTVMENVLSGQLGYTGTFKSIFRKFPPDVVDSAIKLLERVGLLDYVDSRADQLSGGQRQRVGIARALIQRPDLLLVDEPTASLDPKTARQIMRLIVELVIEYKLAVIINIHDVQLAQMFAQRIVGLRDGIVVYDGTPDQVDNSVLTEIYGEEDWDQGKKRHAQEEDDDEDDDIDQVE
ncbi:MAG: phosphonate ABC transporter ATP-binding protein [Sphaerochaetaceae bacterium]|jgi:phosphonate transport system ATP-binding protein|nr:phosphonate ABC transporter ATP-binding protein [Sphaerochaetaceae bacterium]MDD2405691.1 phosphonate ABC transporter ATP-binding protein [Sphaerochaetaceae bacterium]MDD3670719.1 phosphonate ABC transporter ATP-binding protein [Sphaerochaetaceae bacterium]MDD4260377.1 phosphonate ABC transporter ATP-binding protein [Sphaerochaetaceae bacterium]MDD4842265.1 phosphonate ABC transporter ATP-binding protein [Sphaerochaetaceae bacterium]